MTRVICVCAVVDFVVMLGLATWVAPRLVIGDSAAVAVSVDLGE